jgi:hypothetical protein
MIYMVEQQCSRFLTAYQGREIYNFQNQNTHTMDTDESANKV